MITESLIDYIKIQLDNNVSRELIISQLSNVGWHMDDIEEGLSKVASLNQEIKTEESIPINSEVKNIYTKDPYHEEVDSSLDLPASNVGNYMVEESLKNQLDYPTIKPTESYQEPIKKEVNNKEEVKIETQIETQPTIKPQIETKPIVEPKVEPIPDQNPPKIWVPTAINPINPVTNQKEEVIEKPEENTSLETYPEELNKPGNYTRVSFPKDIPAKKLEPFAYQIKQDLIPDIKSKPALEYKKETIVEEPVVRQATEPVVDQVTEPVAEAVIKPIEEKIVVEEMPSPKPIDLSVKEEIINPSQEKVTEPIIPVNLPQQKEIEATVSKVEDFIIPNMKTQESAVLQDRQMGVVGNIPKKAMISSYSQDYMSANKLQQEVTQRKKHSIFKILIILLTLIILGGLVFAFSKGYIKVLGKNMSLISKDPQTLLLNNVNKFNSLTSYKVETEVNVSLPLFANITSGLMSGEAVTQNEKEFFSYKVLGKVNKNNKTELFSDYDITLASSMLKDEIKTNIKSSIESAFITIPDLTMIFGENAPPQGIVSMPISQINQINIVIPDDVKERINNLDLTKLIPSANSNYVTNKISSKDFIKDFEFIKKDEEKIHDIDTNHYVINIENQSLKNILNNIIDESFAELTSDQKIKIKESLGSVSVKSLKFWVGQKDENIYRYKFSLSIPLSKVIGLEDKSIANNEVLFDWQTTFYDLNVINKDDTPMASMNMSDFLKNIADMKIKNTISSFSPLAQEMKNTTGSFGAKSNVTGSCINPAEGSIFSPVGHNKKASSVVGKISDSMNSIVNKLSGDPQCFSTSKAWAISSPLVSDSSKYFCVDSVGNSRILNESLSTTICE